MAKKKKTKKKKYKRARTKKGHYRKDDKNTPFWNEAWQGGKSPKKKKLAFFNLIYIYIRTTN